MAPTDSNFGPLIETRLRVLTWNLWWRFGPWEERLEPILATAEATDADVFCLQEVWLDGETSPATMLAERIGGSVVHANRVDLEGYGFANAIVSRWPITDHDWRPLPSPEEYEEYRTVLRADIDGPRGPIQVFCTHLHWRLDHSAIRSEQVETICRFVADSPSRDYPAVVCGDFNAEPDSDEIRLLTGKRPPPVPKLVFFDAWRHAGEGPGYTWTNANPFAAADLDRDCRIDYVFVGWPKHGGAGHVTDVELAGDTPVDGVWPSDHLGVLAQLRY